MIKKEDVILKCWHSVVAFKKHQLLTLGVNKGHFQFSPYEGELKPCGFYAAYHEGIFVFFATEDGKVLIGWKDKLVDVPTIYKAEWSSKASGRCFEAFDQSGQSLMLIRYQTLKQYLWSPFKLLYDILIPDDDWGLVADIPSFIHSHVKSGEQAELGVMLQQILAGE